MITGGAMYRVICLLILLMGTHCTDAGVARPDLGTGLQDFSLAAVDLAVADLSPAPPDLSPTDQGGSASARICSSDGWCWENPLPQGNTLSGVWGTSASSVWAVGQAGTILKWNQVSARNC